MNRNRTILIGFTAAALAIAVAATPGVELPAEPPVSSWEAGDRSGDAGAVGGDDGGGLGDDEDGSGDREEGKGGMTCCFF